METGISLCSLDVLPAGCAMEAEVAAGSAVRFRAQDRLGRCSLWSGWFSLADVPIVLTWQAFEWVGVEG